MAQKNSFKPPVGVARAAERALQWISEGKQGSGFTNVGRQRAAQLAAREAVSADTIKRMKSFFARHAVDRDASGFRLGEKGYPSAGRVAWDAWGGDAGRTWANTIANKIDRELKKQSCPIATQNPTINTINQDQAVKIANYGPTDPKLPNDRFWQERAERFETTPELIKARICGNCAAFDTSDDMKACIIEGAETEPSYRFNNDLPQGHAVAIEEKRNLLASINAGEVGYCHIFKFKCAAARTCDAWNSTFEKHQQGTHDQETHGNWAGEGSSSGKVYRTANFEEAVARLAKGEVVELKDVQAVHTFVKDLHDYAVDAKKRGEDAPSLDLCKVSVPKTNLFCGKSLGIERVDMPQLSGTPREGSEAAKLPRTKSGNVNVGKQFTDYLERKNVEVRERTVKASSLSASQSQLVGPKVAALMDLGADELADERIFVSRDGYVIDGHHRWAASVGLDASDNQLGDVDIKVVEIDMPIAKVLKEANKFTRRIGIEPQVAKALVSYGNNSYTLKKEQERRYTLGPLYIPDRVDAHGEFTDADELQKAVWKYVQDGDRRIRLQHNRDVVAGEWVEVMTWPYEMTIEHQMADGSVQKAEYPANTVFMGVVWKDWAWNLVKEGKVRGYSIGGKAERIDVELDD